MKLTGKKFLLILLYAPAEGGIINTPIAGRTRLTKMGFLFEKEILKKFQKDTRFESVIWPEYFAWKYGPFSNDLLNDLEFLINRDYINAELSKELPTVEELEEFDYWAEGPFDYGGPEFQQEVFSLTSGDGIDKAKEIWDILTPNQKTILTKFKAKLNSAPLYKILDYVYKEYKIPYTEKSIIKERF